MRRNIQNCCIFINLCSIFNLGNLFLLDEPLISPTSHTKLKMDNWRGN